MSKIKIEKDNPLNMVLIVFFILILGYAFITQAIWLINGVRLASSGQVAEAEVEDWYDVRHNKQGGKAYYVQYHFDVDGTDYVHPAQGTHFFERAGIKVPFSIYEEAKQNRQLTVVYLPARPTINRPAGIKLFSWFNAGHLFPLVVFIPLVMILTGYVFGGEVSMDNPVARIGGGIVVLGLIGGVVWGMLSSFVPAFGDLSRGKITLPIIILLFCVVAVLVSQLIRQVDD
jgi:hypothetical protein